MNFIFSSVIHSGRLQGKGRILMVHNLGNTYIDTCKNNQYTLSKQKLRKPELQEISVLPSLKLIFNHV